MRKITVISMISMDGVMQGPGGREEDTSGGFKYGGWTVAYSDEIFGTLMTEEMKQADYMLGRKTYDIFSAYWPQHNDIWPAVNEGNKYILSQTLDSSFWKNTSFLKNVDEIKKLKASEGRDIQVWGSSQLVQLLLKHDLVDVLRLKTYPLLMGEGKKLFSDGAMPSAFKLTTSYVTTKGVIIADYMRQGEIVTGDIDEQ